MNTRVILGITLTLLLAMPAFALAENPPSGFGNLTSDVMEKAYKLTYSNRGWSKAFGLPQSQFSIDENDYYDPSIEFGEVGFYILGAEKLLNPQYAELDYNQTIPQEISLVAQHMLPWVWTPVTESFGTHHGERLPNNGVATVVSQIQGVAVANNTCYDEGKIAFNEYAVPRDSINKQPTTLLTSIAGAGYTFIVASKYDETNKEKFVNAAKRIADNMLGSIVTPEGEAFGIHPEQTKDAQGNVLPVGSMPAQYTVKLESPDTPLCADGGTIKINENRKTYSAQAALFLYRLGKETGEQKYTRASQLILDGILNLQDCDYTYSDYTRWEGPAGRLYKCKPSDGSQEYTAYSGSVATTSTRGFYTDTALLLYLASQMDDKLYTTNAHYKNAVISMLELEEKDIGAGLARNGDALKYASYSLPTDDRPLPQIMLANVLLRASCQESSEALQKRMQKAAYTLTTKADNLIGSELNSKVANAISPDVGFNMLATAMTADIWKISQKGCEDCKDNDNDGYIDGVCAKDTKKFDCNDSNPNVHPGATEVCDAVDNDCDGKVDNGFDADNDGSSTCAEPVDCNDNDSKRYPGALETIDNIDNDCDNIPDNAGVQLFIQNDANVPFSGVNVVLIDYGSACANSFASLTENIQDIKAQCSTIGECTTDANGMCLVQVKKNGKFQALADIPKNGKASNPIEYTTGQRVPVTILLDSNATTGGSSSGPENPFTSNPYVLAGFAVVGIIIAGGIVAYLIRTNKMPKVNIDLSFMKKPLMPKGPMHSTQPTKRAPIVLPKIPKFSGGSIASKIVGGKPLGHNVEAKMLRPGNFTKKPAPSKPRKVWKDE